jgi:hypothetical protein
MRRQRPPQYQPMLKLEVGIVLQDTLKDEGGTMKEEENLAKAER